MLRDELVAKYVRVEGVSESKVEEAASHAREIAMEAMEGAVESFDIAMQNKETDIATQNPSVLQTAISLSRDRFRRLDDAMTTQHF